MNQLGEFSEFAVIQAEVNAVHREQGHGGLFHRDVAGALADSQNGRVHHFHAFGQRHDRVRHAESEIHVKVRFEAFVDAGLDLAHKILHRVR